MADILLTTLNARFSHASFGLRYLAANLGDLRPRAEIMEFEISRSAIDVVTKLIERNPIIVGFGVYIWNVTETTEIVEILKRVRPNVIVVLGGPEVSYETAEQRITAAADYVVCGEGDRAFRELCTKLLAGERPAEKIIEAQLPKLDDIAFPYDEFTEADLAHRILYVEASRGCPFECEFCLSALDIPVRQFAIDRFLAEMQRLLDRGARLFKFVDRTFNLNLPVARAILEFFLARYWPGLFLHFEMIPDRLPQGLRDLIAAFPHGALQFEVGVQTLDDATAARISRRQDTRKLAENLQFLAEKTGVHVHADLVLGLPGETLESIASGFDRLFAMGPHEIQVGILKRLRGTPIVRHTEAFKMVYSPLPPYEILESSTLDFSTLQRLGRLAKTWDHLANSGNFIETSPLFWKGRASPFFAMLEFSDWLFARHGAVHSIALTKLVDSVFVYLTEVRAVPAETIAPLLWSDYRRGGRSDRPACLKPYIKDDIRAERAERLRGLERQGRRKLN